MIMNRIKQSFSSEKGFMDIQSVMVGVIISAIVAGVAFVSLIGLTRMISDDNNKTTLSTLSKGLETYYTDKDKYPATLAELADGKYVPQNYKKLTTADLCYVPATGAYPQNYTVTAKSVNTGKFLSINADNREPVSVTTYPVTTTCK